MGENAIARSFATYRVDPSTLERAVLHLVELVDAESTSGREAAAVDAAETICRELDLPTERMPAAPRRDNLLIGPRDARILLCTHLDTVPPHIPPRVDATHVHGRGACDAKGAAIAMIYALRALRAEGAGDKVACLLVVGEETDHVGARAAVAAGLRPWWIILGEPCGMRPAVAQKGLVKLELSAQGVAGHSAYPDVGQSATHQLIDALHELRHAALPSDDTLGATTVNVGWMQGGVAANVIAPEAHATVLIRCAAPVDSVIAAVLDVTEKYQVRVREQSRAEPIDFYTGEPDGAGGPDGEVGEAVPFNTDASILRGTGARLMLMGPGDMRVAHADRERLAITDLSAGIEAYARAVTRLL